MTSAGTDMNGFHPVDKQLLEESRWDFSDLKALFINCTLKRSPELSNTQALADRSIAIMRPQASASRSSERSITTSRPGSTRT